MTTRDLAQRILDEIALVPSIGAALASLSQDEAYSVLLGVDAVIGRNLGAVVQGTVEALHGAI